MKIKNQSGQLLLPMLVLFLLLGIFLAGYLRWCKVQYWKMRMNVAAEMTALSVARAQARSLNIISFNNDLLNRYLGKGKVPGLDVSVGATTAKQYAAMTKALADLQDKVDGFSRPCIAMGTVVSRLNGAKGVPIYAPMPMVPQLVPKRIFVAVFIQPPLPLFYLTVINKAYYARSWSPGRREAQPSLTTTWRVEREGACGIATARLWLDARLGTLSNGGFPRDQETFVGGVGIQSLYPQFSARLAPTKFKTLLGCQ